jgi:CheY-like chemotaxis protein
MVSPRPESNGSFATTACRATPTAIAPCTQDKGYLVEAALHGHDALDRVYQHCPDAIVTDLMMPVMDGWTFIRECRRAPAACGLVPISVMSAHFDFRESVSKLEVRACFAKPFDLDVMLEVIGRVL